MSPSFVSLRKSRSARAETSSSHKVVIRLLDGSLVKGVLVSPRQPRSNLPRTIKVRTEDTKVVPVALSETKAIFYVKDLAGNRDYREKKHFIGQPEIKGLWIRLHFKDHEDIEGIIPNSLASFVGPGFYFKPPDPRSNNELIYVNKKALLDMVVLDVLYPSPGLDEFLEKIRTAGKPPGNRATATRTGGKRPDPGSQNQ